MPTNSFNALPCAANDDSVTKGVPSTLPTGLISSIRELADHAANAPTPQVAHASQAVTSWLRLVAAPCGRNAGAAINDHDVLRWADAVVALASATKVADVVLS